MSKKQLISASDVQDAARRGEHVLYLNDKKTIVTAQATSVAKDLGVTLELKESAASESATSSGPDERAVRQALAKQMGGEVREDLVAEVMRRVAAEIKNGNTQKSPDNKSKTNGVRKIATIKINQSGGAGVLASKLDLSTLVTDGVMPRAVGFMAWSKSAVPFHSECDEVHVVLEGELQFRCQKDTLTVTVGDVVLIPKGLAIDISANASVRLLYLSYKG